MWNVKYNGLKKAIPSPCCGDKTVLEYKYGESTRYPILSGHEDSPLQES